MQSIELSLLLLNHCLIKKGGLKGRTVKKNFFNFIPFSEVNPIHNMSTRNNSTKRTFDGDFAILRSTA